MHRHSVNAKVENMFWCCWRKCLYREYRSYAELKEHVEKSHLSRIPLHCPMEGCDDTFKHHHMLSPHFLEEHPAESQNIASFSKNNQAHKSSLPHPPPPPAENLPLVPPAPIPMYLLHPLSVTCCQWPGIVMKTHDAPAFDWLTWLDEDADSEVKGQLRTIGASHEDQSSSTGQPAGQSNPLQLSVRRCSTPDPEGQLSAPWRRSVVRHRRATASRSTIGFYKFKDRVGLRSVVRASDEYTPSQAVASRR